MAEEAIRCPYCHSEVVVSGDLLPFTFDPRRRQLRLVMFPIC